jgi:hypothetical protein
MSSDKAVAKLSKALPPVDAGSAGAVKAKSAGAALGKLTAPTTFVAGAPLGGLNSGAMNASAAGVGFGKIGAPTYLAGIGPGSVTSAGFVNGSKLATSLLGGKGLSLGLGLGLGAWGPLLLAGTVCFAGYGAYRIYNTADPKGRQRLSGMLGHKAGSLASHAASLADELMNAIRSLVPQTDDEAALAAKLAADTALAKKLLAEAAAAEKRAREAGSGAEQAARQAAAAQRKAKAALEAQHMTEARLASWRARKSQTHAV